MQLTFLGATRTVTGSKFLVETDDRKILVDCGLFQGLKELRLRNRAPFPLNPADLDAVVLTHAHLDHSGYLPLLMRNGFAGPVHSTEATADTCAILLPDSGHLQEEEAERANRYGYSKHTPALPLYTRADAQASLASFATVAFEREVDIGGGLSIRFDYAGHILGAAIVTLRHRGLTVVFSGDLGRPADPMLFPPARIPHADYLLVESTYGDRDHVDGDPADRLADIINRTARRGGTVIIPANAVGRSQLVMHYMHRLRATGAIPDLPVFLDSPMAANATTLFVRHHRDHKLDERQSAAVFGATRIINSVEESKAIDTSDLPKVVISASGMVEGGRVLHHLKRFGGDRRNTILFVGYQAAGTRGSALIGGSRELRIHGETVAIKAEVAVLDGLSAHADYPEILDWLGGFEAGPRRTFIVHGEPAAAEALRNRIRGRLRWECEVPGFRQKARLEPAA
jgi:metallo-beta-lactamase family protein